MANIEKDVKEVVQDLKTKIDNLTAASDGVDGETKVKIDEIKDKAIGILSNASNKVVETYQTLADSDEVEKGIKIVKTRSKQLYDNAMKKIVEVKGSEKYKNTTKYVKQTAEQVKTETGAFIKGTKENIDEFFERPEVRQSIDNAKLKTVDVAEKALDTLKQWLKPEDENK